MLIGVALAYAALFVGIFPGNGLQYHRAAWCPWIALAGVMLAGIALAFIGETT